jgi:leucyl aminopeptidase
VVQFDVIPTPFDQVEADLLVVGATRRGEGDDAAAVVVGADGLADALELDLGAELAALDVDGSVGSTARIPTRGRIGVKSVLVVGLGDEGEVTTDAVRKAGAALAAASSRLETVATTLPAGAGDDAEAAAQALAEGVLLGGYAFSQYKSDADEHRLATVRLVGDVDGGAAERGVTTGAATAAGQTLVRDLVNLPPGFKRPSMLAERAREELADSSVDVTVLGPEELEAGGYGGLLGVCAGSSEGPRLVQLDYAPEGATKHIVLVGKGITFDSGGLSLKPPQSMETMKMDMGGAATVLGVVKTVAALGLAVRVTGLLAIAENMPSGSATRPGDVLTIKGGKTVEVLNTDAEGRLVMADALVHAGEMGPDAIVDMATLTGAALVAMGEEIGILMTDDEEIASGILAAGERTAEPFWRLPVAKDQYRKKLDSEVADIKNTGGRNAGTITAGLFLQEFVADGIPWAHLDIAGVAWADAADGYVKKGGTGVPVRMLVDWLANV